MFIISAFVAFPAFHLTRSLMLLMFPLFFFIAEKWVIHRTGKANAVITVLLPYVLLVIWFAVKNSNW